MRDDEDIYAYGQRMANELQTMIEELGAENVLAFMAEPVVGATLGAVPATEGYFKRIRQICDENGILLIADEVMCGLGRTGTYFASEAEGIQPDIITVAKGLGGGYQPIGAALLSQDIFDTISNGSGFFQHGHTFIGHACAAAAALATQQIVINENLVGKVKENGVRLKKHLRDRLGEHAHVGDIRGRGFFLGLELVKDKETKESFDPSERIHAKIKAKAMENGLMCYPMGGTIDGRIGDHILLAPAFITSDAELQQGVELLAKSIEAVV
jgi:adenosylmethionine-8-amino-7-oxononanoate aminotransferase